jgi:hypothetical protein
MRQIALTALLALACAGGAQAQTPATAPAATPAPAVQTPAVEGPQVANTCLQSTGSRITEAQNRRAVREGRAARCANAPGRSYSAEDLQRTGQVSLADALRSLDTSVR